MDALIDKCLVRWVGGGEVCSREGVDEDGDGQERLGGAGRE